MKKIYLPLLLVSVLVLSGCGVATPSTSSESTTVEKTETNSVATSLKELLGGGKDQKCTWTVDDGENAMSGEIMISGKKFRQEVVFVDPETKAENRMFGLSDGEFMYTWSNAMGTQGFKINLAEAESEAKDLPSGEPVEGKIDFNTQYQYKCQPWKVSEADLMPPKEITFTDMADQLKQIKDLQQKYGGNMDIPNGMDDN